MIRLPQVALTAAFLMIASGSAWAEPEKASDQAVAADSEPAPTQEAASDPVLPTSPAVQMLRTLQLMQDQIGLGSTEAHTAQRGLLTVLDRRFMELDDETWKDGKNIRTAIAFVLSGGNPQILRKLLGLGKEIVPVEERPLIGGALAYVEGREEEARRALMPIDVTTLTPTFGAQIALVQSALIVKTDPKRSMELLDWVRLMAPGTLLEEGALRREVFVASVIDDARKFESLVVRYLRQFRNSIYAGNFRQRLASALARIDFGKDPERFGRVVTMLNELEPDVRRDLYLLMARSSVEQGFVGSAIMTAEKAMELSQNDRVSAARASLYTAAASVVDLAAFEKSVRTLNSIDRTILPATDVQLLDSAISLSRQIRLSPEKPSGADRPKIAANESRNETQASEQLPALSRAQEALNRVDKLIKN
ncbi:chemotaxis protein MotC [Microvirga massiliensis]|uniref:chemotaxis protein MotC n=1 Tax=Microvirga massiliensis TaxID=1033741 RepID=UPI000A424FDF|nr:chemotaxis protein MotC [Microvirga massiliensis]